MTMDTNLSGRVRHTKLPKNRGLLPLFEAVVNSIHALEEKRLPSEKGKITVNILRTSTLPTMDKTLGDIIGFKIIDNGIGFNDENMKSFQTLDSEHKAEKGCIGVGRLLWLKAFKNARVNSVYSNGEKVFRRQFDFKASLGVNNEINEEISNSESQETSVWLSDFEESYRKGSEKKAETIAKSLLEHCLWFFIRQGGAPQIVLQDGSECLALDNIFEASMHSSAKSETVKIKNKDFEFTHIKLHSNSIHSHMIAYCAANRVVKQENIKGKIPGLYDPLKDEKGEFVYSCYVSSPYLDEHVRSERTEFDIDEEKLGGLFDEFQISISEIRSEVFERANRFLADSLEENKLKGSERIHSFVSDISPRYRPIISRIPKEDLCVDPNISDKDLELELHKHLSAIERELLSQGHEIMNPSENESWESYNKRLQKYLSKVADVKKSDLAGYVSHRKVILDLFEKATQSNKNGKYAREDIIHGLIMPMGTDSNQVLIENNNLWLLDERLAFHNYLASDKTLSSMPIIESPDKNEPDICALNVFDNPILVSDGSQLPLASIVVIEIKRPMRNDAAQGEDKDPIEQALGYLERIRNGNVKTAIGRPIPNSLGIPGFCYVVSDITPSLEMRCKVKNLKVTSDKMGYFGYNQTFNTYIEVMSYDRLVNAAKQRNRAFFDKLGLPSK